MTRIISYTVVYSSIFPQIISLWRIWFDDFICLYGVKVLLDPLWSFPALRAQPYGFFVSDNQTYTEPRKPNSLPCLLAAKKYEVMSRIFGY
ncbi:hypothetical protein Nepgr_026343 [Nepenthes gracilis]|uniref:Uncharacterized protein n=1 Tax=Nepenthes gracilis TaxID=150966 RepID=A0AAD3T6R9_NEPGR|nr:hypothetical protein Nepgr_026343 [Nepenthes gracilis]